MSSCWIACIAWQTHFYFYCLSPFKIINVMVRAGVRLALSCWILTSRSTSGNFVKMAGSISFSNIAAYSSLPTFTGFVSMVPWGLFALLRLAGTLSAKGQITILPTKMLSPVSGWNLGRAVADRNRIFGRNFLDRSVWELLTGHHNCC